MNIDDVTTEEWRPIPGYEGLYEASSHGRVRSMYGKTARILRGGVSKFGWRKQTKRRQVFLCLNGKVRSLKVARVIALTFHGQPPAANSEANHKDGNALNDSANNIEWSSPADNRAQAVKTAAWPRGETHHSARITEKTAREILGSTMTNRKTASHFGVSYGTVCAIKGGYKWSHIHNQPASR